MGHGRENVLGKTTTDGVTRNQCQFSRHLRSMSLPLSSEEIDLMKAAITRPAFDKDILVRSNGRKICASGLVSVVARWFR